MLKGVNHQIIEVTKPSCEYFERVIFFVKPEFSAVSEGTLRDRASTIAGEAGAPPPSKVRRDRLLLISRLLCAAITGAAVTVITTKLLFG
ncbi:MAG: hypothetical protein IKT61_02210 [Clostridia bacterium]|nr:hypothetical protein [Clostridia bacterium]